MAISLICKWHVSQRFSQILPLWIYGEDCTDSVVKSKQFEQMSSAWWQMKALLKLFTTVTDFLMFLKFIYKENIKMKLLEFQKQKSMIFTLEIKMNHFTFSAVKSKQIELQRSAWWYKIAFLQNFLMVTIFFIFFLK